MTIRVKNETKNFVAGDYLTCMRDFALHKHISVKALLAGSGKDIDFLLDPPKKVDEHVMNMIAFNLFKMFPKPIDAAIEFGKSMSMSTHGALGLAIQGCQQLSDVALLTQQYFKTRSSARVIHFVEDEHYTFLRLDNYEAEHIPAAILDTRFYTSLSSLINIDQLIKELLSHHHVTGQCILRIQRPKPSGFDIEQLPNHLTVEFESQYFELGIPSSWMQLTLKQGDIELAKMATNECESTLKQLTPKDLIQQIHKALNDAAESNVSLQTMAKSLNMSVSTLQRRLKELHTTYQNIKSEVRINKAKALLRHTDQPLDSIADALGYSDASNFSKSFKAQTGQTPKLYRNQ